MKILRLKLPSPNLPAQKEFYTSILQLPAKIQGDDLIIQAGATEIIFTRSPKGWNGSYHFCFNIPKNKFAESKGWLAAKIPLLKDEKGNDQFHSNSWNADSLYFKDGGGNILEFIARHELDVESTMPFDGNSILSVSEIGLPSKDVISFAKELCENLGVSVYKQEPDETFTPIGDENGLLILPVEDRIWYPNTGVPAKLLDVNLHIEVNGKIFQISGMPYEIKTVT